MGYRRRQKTIWHRSGRDPECNNGITGIRNQSSKQQVRLRKERTTTNGIGAWKGQQLFLGSGGMHMKALYEMVSVKITKQNADILPGCEASRSGHCGGVGPLQNG
jgi:hypothetical protein